MHKREIAHFLRALGSLLEIKGEIGFKVRSYEKAAKSIERGDFPLLDMAKAGKLLEIPDVGRNLEPKISEMILTGKSSYMEKVVQDVPYSLLELLNIPGVGPKTTRMLFEVLGVKNLDDFEEALKNHQVQSLPGVGMKREDMMIKGLAEVRKYLGRVSVGVAFPVASHMEKAVSQNGIPCQMVGGLRRFEETVDKIELLVGLNEGETPHETIEKSGLALGLKDDEIIRAWDQEQQRFVLTTGLGVPLVVYLAPLKDFWAKVFWLTGPEDYVNSVARAAKDKGFRYGPDGFFAGDAHVCLDGEEVIFTRLGFSYLPPEVRHRPEFALLSEEGRHIDLILPQDIKGDLHTHTIWSDGVDTVENMVVKAISMGYSYLAITDHATFMKVIDGITPEKLDAYLGEIEESRKKHPDFRIFAGVEVDVAKDGSLFLSNEHLRVFDVVVASVHQDLDSQGNPVERLAEAAKNPYVRIIGHPTGRLIGRRPGVQTGLAPLFKTAAETGTILEINSSPERLDLPEVLVEEAHRLGARFTVSTDAHSPGGLLRAQCGVRTCAMRAGLPPQKVINTFSAPPWLSGKLS